VCLVEAWEFLDPPWQVAFELAWDAFLADTIPVGAVVVDENETVVVTGRNRVFEADAPTRQLAGTRLAHAEINALAQLPAGRHWDGYTLYTTLEPCVACVGAASVSSIGRIRFAGADVYSGSSSLAGIALPISRRLNVTIEGPLEGPFEELGAALHLAFFIQGAGRAPLLVDTHSARRPDLFPLARGLLAHRTASLERALSALDGV